MTDEDEPGTDATDLDAIKRYWDSPTGVTVIYDQSNGTIKIDGKSLKTPDEEPLAEAERRFNLDEEFHARCYRAMEAAQAAVGRRLTQEEIAVALRTAGVALVLAEEG